MAHPRNSAAVLGVLAMAASGCAGCTSTAGRQPVDGRTFTLAIGSDPASLDPHLTVLSVTSQVDRFLYDSLLDLTADGKPVAGLAGKWTATTTTASFTLRAGISCADDTPLTAADVAANIDFVGDPASKSPVTGQTVAPGTSATADEATRTITVTSGKPDAFLLRDIGTLPIVCGKALRDRKLATKGEGGTGMFTITEAVPGDHYTLTRRTDYAWGPGTGQATRPGLPDRVVVRVVPDTRTAAGLLLSGELNAATITGPERQLPDAKGLAHADFVAPLGELFYNQADGRPGHDESVRRGLTQALDLARLGSVLTDGTGTPSTGMVTAAMTPCPGDTVTGNLPVHDPAAAASALDTAGWKPGPDGVRVKKGRRLELTVLYGTQLGPTMTATAELARQAWQSLGAAVTVRGLDGPALSQELFGTGGWDVLLGPIGFASPNQMVPFVSGPAVPAGTNFAHIENAGYDERARQAATMVNDTGCPLWTAAETALIARVDAVPYIDSVVPTYAHGAGFEISQTSIKPSSIRMYAE
ncbi:ABC transporter substrate-binding protein [Amycolatopsis mongoliensis]|uniref:ABC transporter substrate-binding protein n=1 Tax=Amycolatopsis mongoliensis TaxID=715475 RepID=A0A9Y2NEC2_9PSEU|nr:ABC transporter substrate-binding protein [Amycolatopsis sp. 4-36]WIX98543.1 ABC transporter substrate-binding protein [Amycolatopsis sp. 4-36]